MSAQADDKPRWGDYPEKTNLTYISGLIRNGGWFDGSHPFIFNGDKADDGSDKFYEPQFMLENYERYKYLLQVPDSDGKRYLGNKKVIQMKTDFKPSRNNEKIDPVQLTLDFLP